MILVLLTEIWKGSKLQSEKPQALRSCVAQVAPKFDGDVSRAFAICTAALQKAGKLKKGTQDMTKAGKKEAKARAKRKGSKQRDIEYERLVSAARKSK